VDDKPGFPNAAFNVVINVSSEWSSVERFLIFSAALGESFATSTFASTFAALATFVRSGPFTVTMTRGVCPSFGRLPWTAVTDVPERIRDVDSPDFAAARSMLDSAVTIARADDGFVFRAWTGVDETPSGWPM